MPRFEDRLWAELVEQHGALLADGPSLTPVAARSRPRRRRRAQTALAALGLALAGAVTAVVIGLSSGGGTAAYAVVSKPDGTISLTISELVGVTGADQQLISLAVPVRVVRAEAGCQVSGNGYKSAQISPQLFQRISKLSRAAAGSAAVAITPSAIPSGETVVIGARELAPGVVGLERSIYQGAVPPCLPLSG